MLWFATLFGAITYAAFSTRALLNPYEINSFVDAKRVVSVLLGAVVLWLALRAADRLSGQKAADQTIAILRVAALGVLTLFVAREIYDLIESGELAARLAMNIRFMLTWIGYFAAAVAIFLALDYYRQLQAMKAQGAIDPIRSKDRSDVKTLLKVLRAQTGYESADIDVSPGAHDRNQRLAQIDRLLERLA